MKSFLKTRDFAVSGEVFELVHDDSLDMLVTTPKPTDLEAYYNSAEYISHSDTAKGFVSKVYQLVKKWSLVRKLRLINSFIPEGTKLLDVGAGTGEFVLAALKNGWKASGLEPALYAREKAVAKGAPVFLTWDDVPCEQFDVITLWHVLEHLPDLESEIEKLDGYLAEDGLLVLAVPNFKSWDAQFYGPYWAAYDVPRHLWHFSRESISLLFRQKGFEIVITKPLLFDAFYVALLSEKYKRGATHYLHAFINGLRSNWAARNNQEYSSVIYMLKRS